MILPKHAGVANAIGAVVGRVTMGGSTWRARALDQAFAPGRAGRVAYVDGMTLIIEAVAIPGQEKFDYDA